MFAAAGMIIIEGTIDQHMPAHRISQTLAPCDIVDQNPTWMLKRQKSAKQIRGTVT